MPHPLFRRGNWVSGRNITAVGRAATGLLFPRRPDGEGNQRQP